MESLRVPVRLPVLPTLCCWDWPMVLLWLWESWSLVPVETPRVVPWDCWVDTPWVSD
ncbi:hypothetical protein GCM10010452_86730 [Crossiella cryophila]